MSEAVTPSPRNYLVRHWRGEFSLAHAFWINEVLLSLACLLATSPLYFMLVRNPPSPTGLLLMGVPFMAGALAVTLWQGVGVWRSARYHRQRGGKSRWVTVVRILVIVGAVQTAYSLFDVVPAFKAALRLAMDPNALPTYRITALGDSELEFSGGIAPGSFSAFEQAVADHPDVTTVQLDSVGGLFGEARAIARLIEDKGLSTYTNRECVSACALVFMSGKQRLLGAEGKLGFHAATLFESGEASAAVVEQYRDALLKHGASRQFVDKVLATGREDMWFPDITELKREHIITATADARDFTDARLAKLREPGQLDVHLRKYFQLHTLAEDAPAQYEVEKAKAQNALDKASTFTAFDKLTRDHDTWLIQDALRKAPAPQLLRFWQAQAALVNAVGQGDEKICAFYLSGVYPGGYSALPATLLALFTDRRNSQRELVKAAAEVTGDVTPTAQARADLNRVFTHAEPGTYDAYRQPTQHAPAQVCQAHQELYRRVLALPNPTRVAEAFRLLPGYTR